MTYAVSLLNTGHADLLESFLCAHTAEAYWLRSNALAAGLDYQGQWLQGDYFGAFQGDALVGVISYTWLNTILIFAQDPACIPVLVAAVLPRLQQRGGTLDAILGLAEQARTVIHELHLPESAIRNNEQSLLFRLSLDRLRVPDATPDQLVRRATEKDRERLIEWRMAFNIEAIRAMPGPELEQKVRDEIDNRLPRGELFVLEQSSVPASYCGIGGHVPDTTMVGPVWTPPENRNRGFGRAVIALALDLLRNERPDLRHAVLFASRPDAIHIYESIGFERLADWGLVFLNNEKSTCDCPDNDTPAHDL